MIELKFQIKMSGVQVKDKILSSTKPADTFDDSPKKSFVDILFESVR
jgi:hypothetical protein